jgi:hypothetical protein
VADGRNQQAGGGGLADEQRVNPEPRFVEEPLFVRLEIG